MNEELRCEHKLHGVVVKPGEVEVKCDSKFCGAGNGHVVIHKFDSLTGELIHTKKYRQPKKGR